MDGSHGIVEVGSMGESGFVCFFHLEIIGCGVG
mgnify:FL=1